MREPINQGKNLLQMRNVHISGELHADSKAGVCTGGEQDANRDVRELPEVRTISAWRFVRIMRGSSQAYQWPENSEKFNRVPEQAKIHQGTNTKRGTTL